MRRPCSGRVPRLAPSSAALCALLAALAAVVLAAAPARAHTALVSSTPASGAVVDDRLQVVQLQFSQPLSPTAAQVVVTSPDGAQVADGPATVSGATVTQAVGELPTAGDYRLAYRVLAEDGHPVTGQISFSVDLPTGSSPAPVAQTSDAPAVSASGPSDPSAERAQGTGAGPALVAGLSGVALVLAAGAVRSARRAGAGR